MVSIERELDRYLTLLRNKIRDQGFTQLEVQNSLGWGRSYISQLVTKQKALRMEQVLVILHVIGIEPSAFFGELYDASPRAGASPRADVSQLQEPTSSPDLVRQELQQVRTVLHGLTQLLRTKGLITERELSEAVEAQASEPE